MDMRRLVFVGLFYVSTTHLTLHMVQRLHNLFIFFFSRLLLLARSLHCCVAALQMHRDSGKEFPNLFVSSLGRVCLCPCVEKNGSPSSSLSVQALHASRIVTSSTQPTICWRLTVPACQDVTQDELGLWSDLFSNPIFR